MATTATTARKVRAGDTAKVGARWVRVAKVERTGDRVTLRWGAGDRITWDADRHVDLLAAR